MQGKGRVTLENSIALLTKWTGDMPKFTFSMQMGLYFLVLDYKRTCVVPVAHLSEGFIFSCHCLLIYL